MLLDKALFWLLIYSGCLLIYKLFSYIEYRKHPEKLELYKVLPLKFKLVCVFIAIPLFATSIFGVFEDNTFLSFFWILALGIALILEVKAVEFYKKKGLF